jgi:hypothetical protein
MRNLRKLVEVRSRADKEAAKSACFRCCLLRRRLRATPDFAGMLSYVMVSGYGGALIGHMREIRTTVTFVTFYSTSHTTFTRHTS